MQKRILVVDDEEVFLEGLRINLETHHYQVLSANNGREGLRKAVTEKPDLILMDIMMPELNGYELCQKLREDKRTREIPVIMLTARGQMRDKLTGYFQGADEYIVKPFDYQELLEKIRTLIYGNHILQEKMEKRIEENMEMMNKLKEGYLPVIEKAARAVLDACKKGKKVIFFGNGGSAADAQHLATELMSRFKKERPALAALALTTNTSLLTALSNDYDFSEVFSRQLTALAEEGDVVVGISTSGNSPNVIKGMEQARLKKAVTIGLTGGEGGKLKDVADMVLAIPSFSTPRIQEGHITVGHILCEIVEEEMFRQGGKDAG